MSIHEAKTIKLGPILPHPDPETVKLGVTKVWEFQVVVNKEQWKEGDLAVYIEPDTLVPLDLEVFAFLRKEGSSKTQERIRVKKLRGIYSEGLLIPAPEGLKEDDDAWELLRLDRYQPKIVSRGNGRPANLDSDARTSGGWEEGPAHAKTPFSKYDLENWKKFNHVFEDGEEVIITEKIHGSNGKFLWHEGRMFCGSRTGWRVENDHEFGTSRNLWWEALRQNPWIEEFCKQFPDFMVFGEVHGQVTDLKYGAGKNQIFFRTFDVFDTHNRVWMDNCLIRRYFTEDQRAPILFEGPYSKEKVLECTDGPSLVAGANHIREGCVVKPARERIHPRYGRIALKNVSNLYLERP
jgi:RNA ligase (TIGR02306 family)